MKKIFLASIVFFLFSNANGQGVGINAYGSAPGSNAMLDVASTEKGVVIPRMSTAQRNAIPVTGSDIGLLVYDYEKQRIYMYDGAKWLPFAIEKTGGFSPRNIEPTAVSEKSYFGNAVDIDGEFAVVGAFYDSVGNKPKQGTAHVYRNITGTWTKVAELIASDGNAHDHFGSSVAINGNYIVVGASTADAGANESGAAYVFFRSGASWIQQAKLVDPAPASSEHFATAVDIEGSTIVVGAPHAVVNGQSSRGAVFVFNRVGSAWVQQPKLIDNSGKSSDNLGASVCLEGNYIAAGQPGYYIEMNGIPLLDVGSVCIFFKNGASWGQQAKIPNPTNSQHRFGYKVALYQDKMLVTAIDIPYAKIFTRVGSTWSETQHIFSMEAGGFGLSARWDNDIILIGAPGETADNMFGAGVVLVYKKNASGKYTIYKRLLESAPLYNNGFGGSIGFDGTNFVIGSPSANDEKGKISFGAVAE